MLRHMLCCIWGLRILHCSRAYRDHRNSHRGSSGSSHLHRIECSRIMLFLGSLHPEHACIQTGSIHQKDRRKHLRMSMMRCMFRQHYSSLSDMFGTPNSLMNKCIRELYKFHCSKPDQGIYSHRGSSGSSHHHYSFHLRKPHLPICSCHPGRWCRLGKCLFFCSMSRFGCPRTSSCPRCSCYKLIGNPSNLHDCCNPSDTLNHIWQCSPTHSSHLDSLNTFLHHCMNHPRMLMSIDTSRPCILCRLGRCYMLLCRQCSLCRLRRSMGCCMCLTEDRCSSFHPESSRLEGSLLCWYRKDLTFPRSMLHCGKNQRMSQCLRFFHRSLMSASIRLSNCILHGMCYRLYRCSQPRNWIRTSL